MESHRTARRPIDRQEYDAACAYLGLQPNAALWERLSEYLARIRPGPAHHGGFASYLAEGRLSRFRIARLDLVTRWLMPDHPVRHVLNGVIALHECDGAGYEELATVPSSGAVWMAAVGWGAALVKEVVIAIPWLGWQLASYAFAMPFRADASLAGRRVLVTGVNRGLGRDLMLQCLERGAEIVGTVRDRETLDAVARQLPADAPVRILVADLAVPGALVDALRQAEVPAGSVAIALLCAGVKHDDTSVLALAQLRETFQVNFFSSAELAQWLCEDGARQSPTALVLVSSMGRWHGMHFSCGYNASKAALSIWGESLDMELRPTCNGQFTVTIVEPGMFASGMTQRTPLTRWLFASRPDVARRIVSGAIAGRRTIRPPWWFALLTWSACLAGRGVRYRLFSGIRPRVDR